MNKLIILFCLPLFVACRQESDNTNTSFNKLAEDYVRLALFIGQYDEAFIDAYYGPDSLKPKTKGTVFPKDSLLSEVKTLKEKFNGFINDKNNDTLARRAEWINTQLTAFDRHNRIFSGEYGSFDEE